MKNKYFLISLIILICNFNLYANRSIYVNNFAAILGDTTAENNLLSYAQSNGIDTLLLYELHLVNASNNLSNTATNYVLADFILKAKTNYNILHIGATAENGNFFTNVIDTYNNSRTNPLEKIDIYNLEFEFWVESATNPGGTYCTSYLTPNGLTCNNNGAFQFFISTLQTMNNLATNNTHPITTEAYLGWTTTEQAETIGANLDRIRLHAYVNNPSTAFNYSESRLIDFANGTPELDVSIIYSSEPSFMQNWLENNSLELAENIFSNDWITASSSWTNTINLTGFTYFTYTYMENVTLTTINSKLKPLNIYPNPVKNTLYFNDISKLKKIKVYNSIGKLIIETKKNKIDMSQLTNGIYFLQIQTDNYISMKKVIKE